MPSFLDPAALMRIKSLELRAKVVVEGLWNGQPTRYHFVIQIYSLVISPLPTSASPSSSPGPFGCKRA